MSNRRVWGTLAALSACCAVAAPAVADAGAASASAGKTNTSKGSAASSHPVIGWSPISYPTDTGRKLIDNQYKAAIQRAGGSMDYCAPSQAGQATGDPSLQAQCMSSFILKKVAAIIVWPVDTKAILPSIKQANAAGIPVFLHYTELPSSSGVKIAGSLANADEPSAKAIAANFVAYLKKKNGAAKGSVLVVEGDPTSTDAQQRTGYFVDALKPYKSIHVTIKPADWDTSQGTTVIQAWMTSHPTTDGVYLNTDTSYGISVEAALKAVHQWYRIGSPKHVWVGGIDGDNVGLNLTACHYEDLSSSQGSSVAVPAFGKLVMNYVEHGASAMKVGQVIPEPAPFHHATVQKVPGFAGPVFSINPVEVTSANAALKGLDGNTEPPPNGQHPNCKVA